MGCQSRLLACGNRASGAILVSTGLRRPQCTSALKACREACGRASANSTLTQDEATLFAMGDKVSGRINNVGTRAMNYVGVEYVGRLPPRCFGQ